MDSNIPYFRKFPETYRTDVIDKITACARTGKNIQLIGLKGSGKSQIFRCMLANKQLTNEFDIFQIDFNLIPEKSATAVSKIMLDKLLELEKSPLAFKKKTILLIDSFENIQSLIDQNLERIFAGITNKYREYVSIVFSVDKPIESGSAYWGEELIIPSMNKTDFEWFWAGIGGTDKYKEEIYKASGGHPAIIKRLFEIADSNQNLSEVIANPRLNPHLLYQLELMKEALNGKANYFDVPVYNTFLNGLTANSELTGLENKAFQFFSALKGEVVERDALITAIWGENGSLDISDHALDQLIYRLKNKVKSKAKIITLKGRGYKLIQI